MSVPKCFIFQDLERLTEGLGGMSAGISGRKLPLWADFSFLSFSNRALVKAIIEALKCLCIKCC